ncbi:DUF2059 domain-containing protein [Acidisoma cellulosilytica]|uniref:DUF2059 domain-containing protein n=1 Tax=Acidisoma cellulosilyticum TaxID=2802395 RepID=A0A964E654_9PROT|nr:DUF2059 domain-containing protein [Acidisoma cellulosilyticum]MCB8883244.1 DUF2059 domain-containing protein [Acidisoma cellulosilyticum]
MRGDFTVIRALVARTYPRRRPNAVVAPGRVDPRDKPAGDKSKRTWSFAAVALAGIVLLGGTPALADTAQPALTTEQMQLAMQVVQAIGIQQVADAAVGGLKIVLVQSLAANSKQPPEKVGPIVDQVLMPDILASEPQFVASVATLYGQAFTVPEMQQILAFYQTSVGQKLESVTPGLTQQMVEAGHAWIGQIGEQVLKLDADKLAAQGLKVD